MSETKHFDLSNTEIDFQRASENTCRNWEQQASQLIAQAKAQREVAAKQVQADARRIRGVDDQASIQWLADKDGLFVAFEVLP